MDAPSIPLQLDSSFNVGGHELRPSQIPSDTSSSAQQLNTDSDDEQFHYLNHNTCDSDFDPDYKPSYIQRYAEHRKPYTINLQVPRWNVLKKFNNNCHKKWIIYN